MNHSQKLELQEGSCHLRNKLKFPGVVIHLSINERMKSNQNALPKQWYGFPLAFQQFFSHIFHNSFVDIQQFISFVLIRSIC